MKIRKYLIPIFCMILLNSQNVYAAGRTTIELNGPTNEEKQVVDTSDISLKSLEEYSFLLTGSALLGLIGFSIKERDKKHE